LRIEDGGWQSGKAEIEDFIMGLTAITRDVSSSINDCELSFHPRQPIDVPKANDQPTTAGLSNANM